MPNRYLRYKFEGAHPWEAAPSLLGEAAATAQILRVHSDGRETHVYVATTEAAKPKQKKPGKAAAQSVTEVSLDEVLKIG